MGDQGTEVTESTAVHPDPHTKLIGAGLYSASMMLIGFLALQVWMLNGTMERLTAQAEAQQRFNQRIERALERLDEKVDGLAETAAQNGNNGKD